MLVWNREKLQLWTHISAFCPMQANMLHPITTNKLNQIRVKFQTFGEMDLRVSPIYWMFIFDDLLLVLWHYQIYPFLNPFFQPKDTWQVVIPSNGSISSRTIRPIFSMCHLVWYHGVDPTVNCKNWIKCSILNWYVGFQVEVH